jgi:hypothetical protein
MSDFAEPILDPNTPDRFSHLSWCRYNSEMETPANLTFKFSNYAPISCNVDITEDRKDILEWEEANKELEGLDALNPFSRLPGAVKIREGREPIPTDEADRRVSELLEQRRLEEVDRLEHLGDKAFMSKIQGEQEKARKVRPFTKSELSLLVKKYESQHPRQLSKRPVSCQEAASALLILNAMKKRYGSSKAMHHAIYGPAGYMCQKYWDELVKDVDRLEGKRLLCADEQ